MYIIISLSCFPLCLYISKHFAFGGLLLSGWLMSGGLLSGGLLSCYRITQFKSCMLYVFNMFVSIKSTQVRTVQLSLSDDLLSSYSQIGTCQCRIVCLAVHYV